MKRIFNLLVLTAFILLLPYSAYASTNTEERTEDDLKIWDDIVVTESNKYAILNTPKVNEKEKIYDFADLFTPKEESSLFEEITDYIKASNMDMIIVTISKNNKYTSREYAVDFYDYNLFGKNEYHDGILLLIDMDKRRVEIVTTGYAKLVYDDSRIDDILDNVVINLKNERYNLVGQTFIRSSLRFYEDGIPNSNKGYELNKNGEMVKKKQVNIVLTLIISLSFPTILTFYFISKHKGIILATDANDYIQHSGIIMKNRIDSFLTTHTTRTRIVHSSSSTGGSGRIGGSSISRRK